MAFTNIYQIRQSDVYRNASEVYRLLPDNGKQALLDIIPKELYSTILFVKNVLDPIENYCDKFFDCKDKGFSYHIGCYFQKKEYESDGMIKSDIDRFTSLRYVYNEKDFPNECKLIDALIIDLKACYERYKQFEKWYPELFKKADES